MSEEQYVEKTLKYLEKTFNFIITSLTAIVVYLFFNFNWSISVILATIMGVVLVIALICCAFMLKKYLNKLRRL